MLNTISLEEPHPTSEWLQAHNNTFTLPYTLFLPPHMVRCVVVIANICVMVLICFASDLSVNHGWKELGMDDGWMDRWVNDRWMDGRIDARWRDG